MTYDISGFKNGKPVFITHGASSIAEATRGVEQLCDNTKVMERLKWLERVNDHAGGGSKEAARQLQHFLEVGYHHLVPVNANVGMLAASSLDLILFGVAILFLFVFILYWFASTCCYGKVRATKSKAKAD